MHNNKHITKFVPWTFST